MKELLSPLPPSSATDLSLEEVHAQAQAIIDEWKVAANDARWFDDCLNNKGREEASLAGVEIGDWLRSNNVVKSSPSSTTSESAAAAAPALLVTSPFRRAWQTQLMGFAIAGFGFPGTMPVSSPSSVSSVLLPSSPLSPSSAWVAHDDLSETPHAEASCIRSSKTDIAKWQPCLNVDLITEECEVVPVTNVELGWRSLLKKKITRNAALEPAAAATHEVEKAKGEVAGEEEGEDEEDNEAEAVVISRTASFANWLLARPEDVIWVATHQVTTTFTFIYPPHQLYAL
jgi:hypothetical protein